MSSLITSCPACHTRFKLVPDQLKISDGWVRCGQCREIFDASTRIEQPLSPIARPVPLLTEQWPDSVMPDVAAPSPEVPRPPETPEDADFSESGVPEPASVLAEQDPPLHENVDASRAESPAPAPRQAFQHTEVDIVVDDPGPVDTRILDFVKQDARRHFWHSWPMRIALSLTLMWLTLALGIQFLIHQRDHLAASQPALQPLLGTLCDVAGCAISPVKEPQSLLIDSTRFVKLASDATSEIYKVEIVIKNRADYLVASPALELSLTDHQDRVVLRKVLQAGEYIRHDTLSPQSEQTVSTAVRVLTAQAGARVSGYRVMLFYP